MDGTYRRYMRKQCWMRCWIPMGGWRNCADEIATRWGYIAPRGRYITPRWGRCITRSWRVQLWHVCWSGWMIRLLGMWWGWWHRGSTLTQRGYIASGRRWQTWNMFSLWITWQLIMHGLMLVNNFIVIIRCLGIIWGWPVGRRCITSGRVWWFGRLSA